MNEIPSKHVKCGGCRANIPERWAKEKINGARQVDGQSFCCENCERTYLAREAKVSKPRPAIRQITLPDGITKAYRVMNMAKL